MPYPNEHSVRYHNPSNTRYSKYRRVKDEFGDGISPIYGVLRKPHGKKHVEVQAIRFDASLYSIDDVRHLVSASGGLAELGKPLKIEPALRHNPKKFRSYIVTDTEFNKEYAKNLIGLRFLIPPSYIDVESSSKAPQYHSFTEWYKSIHYKNNPIFNDLKSYESFIANALEDEEKGIETYKQFMLSLPLTKAGNDIKRYIAKIVADEEKHVIVLRRLLYF